MGVSALWVEGGALAGGWLHLPGAVHVLLVEMDVAVRLHCGWKVIPELAGAGAGGRCITIA